MFLPLTRMSDLAAIFFDVDGVLIDSRGQAPSP